MYRKSIWILLLFFVAGCGRKVQPQVQLPPPGPPAYEVAYQDGLKAFREATPEGYRHAADSFRRASTLVPSNCEYSLHLSESLFFLAQKQQANWEDWQPSVQEANAIASRPVDEGCTGKESYLARLRALNLTFGGLTRAAAVTTIQSAVDLDPKDPMNWIVLAQLVQQPSLKDPVAPILHAFELAQDLPVVQYDLGNYYLLNPLSFPKARDAFERAFELSPRHFEAALGIGYSFWLIGDDASADKVEPWLQKSVEMSPGYLRGRSYLGDYYAGLEETEKAAEQYQAAMTSNPHYYPALLSLGSAFMTAERNDDAEKPFRAALDLNLKTPQPPRNQPDFTADSQAHAYLGDIWLQRADLVKAKAEYDAALESVVTYGPAMYGLGTVFHREGRDDEALAQFDKVIRYYPRDFPNAYLSRAGIRVERNQLPAALADLNQAIAIYQGQVVDLKAKVEADEMKGYKRRANGERRRQALIEATLQRALESKKALEVKASR